MFPNLNLYSNHGLIISSCIYGKKYDKIVNTSKLMSKSREKNSLDFPEL